MKTGRVLFVAAVLAVSWVLAASAQAQTGTGALATVLNLTDAQKAAIKAIRENTRQAVQDANTPADKLALRKAAREQIKALLTPEQLAKLQQIRQERVDAMLARLNLTKKQELEIAVIRAHTRQAVQDANSPAEKRALIKSAWGEIKALLTPEQLAKLKEIRKDQHKAHARMIARAKIAKALNLTDAQKAAIKAIRKSTREALNVVTSRADKRAIREGERDQIKALLTPEQLAKLKEIRAGYGNRGVLARLNLTDEQKAAIKAIRKSTREALKVVTSRADKRAIREGERDQIRALLTPEQLAKLKEIRHRP